MVYLRCEAVHPYVPDPSIRWQGIEADTAPLTGALCVAGAFEDPRLNTEFKRFLYRDAIPFAAYVQAFVFFGVLLFVGLLALGIVEWGIFVVFPIAVTAFAALAIVGDGYAFFVLDAMRPCASTIRIWLMIQYGAIVVLKLLINPSQSVMACGDLTAIEDNAAAVAGFLQRNESLRNATENATIAAWTTAVTERQKYCVDTIEIWFVAVVVVLIVMFRLLPVHMVPLLGVLYIAVPFGYLVRDRWLATEETYTTETASVVATHMVLGICAVIAFVRCRRSSEIDRQRFVAAISAERARRMAMLELRQVDSLLKKALPEAVLKRMAADGDFVDDSDAVTVLFASLRSDDASCPGLNVGLLNAIVCELDAQVAKLADSGLSKVKTIGDVYWIVAGLPVAVRCHASTVCRFASSIKNTSERVAAEYNAFNDDDDNDDGDVTEKRGDADEAGAPPLRDIAGAGALSICVGVHSGSATGAILGTQRLSYEPFGDACDGAREMLRLCEPGAVLVSESVKRQLSLEAAKYSSQEEDSDALFATPAEVEHALGPDDAGCSASAVFGKCFWLPPAQPRASEAAALEMLLRRSLNEGEDADVAIRDAASVRSHSADGVSLVASLVQPWVSDAMEDQKAQLEHRLAFLLKRAAAAEERKLSRRARSRGRPTFEAKNRYSVHIASGTPVQEAAPDYGLDAAATSQLAALDDPVNGPFASGSRLPLVYTFADEEEEAGFLAFARDATYVMRRDVRIGTAVLFWACFIFFAATSEHMLHLFAFFVAAVAALINAGSLVLRRLDHADTVMAHASYVAFVVALYLADGHVLGNDPYWAYMVYTLTIFLATWTLSPLARSGLTVTANLAAFAKLGVSGKGAWAENGAMMLAAFILEPILTALSEKYSRRAYVERRLAEALVAQQRAAQHAQQALLASIVPSDFSVPLLRWLSAGSNLHCAPSKVVRGCTVAALHLKSLRPAAASDDNNNATSEEPAPWLLEAHRALDALLDRCVALQKVKTAGHTALLWAPRGGKDAFDADGLGSVAATFTGELMFIAKSLKAFGIEAVASVHTGDVTAAVLGTERVSFDVLGPAVEEAEAALRLALDLRGGGGYAEEADGLITVTAKAIDVLRAGSRQSRGIFVMLPPEGVKQSPQGSPWDSGTSSEKPRRAIVEVPLNEVASAQGTHPIFVVGVSSQT